MPGLKKEPHCVRLHEWVVVLSGSTSRHFREKESPCRRVFAFHTLSEFWAEWAQSRSFRCGAASNGNHLFTLGGTLPSNGKPDRQVCRLNEDHMGWTELSHMPKKTDTCAATVLNDKLYVLGKLTPRYGEPRPPFDPSSTTIQVLDLQRLVWSEITMASTVRSRLKWSLDNPSIIAVRNLILSNRMVGYDTASGESLDLPAAPECPTPAQARVVVAADGQILAIGTAGQGRESRKVHVFNPYSLRQWDELSPMNTARCFSAACTVNGVVYVVGGWGEGGSRLRSMECFK